MGYQYKYKISGDFFTIENKPFLVWECPFSGESKWVEAGDVFIEFDLFGNEYYVHYYYDKKLNETYKVVAQ